MRKGESMAVYRRKTGIIVLVVVLGALVGSAFGTLLGRVLPTSPVKSFFLYSVDVGFRPIHIDIAVLTFDLGIMLRLNIISVVGVLLTAYILRWFY